MWNVVFMGTPDFAVGSLKALLEAGQYHIQAVVTQPDRPKGRGQKMVETPVKTFALQHGLPVFQPLLVGLALDAALLGDDEDGQEAARDGRRADPVRDYQRGKGIRRDDHADGKGYGHRSHVQPGGCAH